MHARNQPLMDARGTRLVKKRKRGHAEEYTIAEKALELFRRRQQEVRGGRWKRRESLVRPQ